MSSISVFSPSRTTTDVLESAEQASRRLARALERRRQRLVTVACAILVGASSVGIVGFAGLLVTAH